ncbi:MULTISPECIES: potassium channel family protein [Geobacillus]|jgi:potassium channel LctB|uniref:Potassium channel family protein n=1 Tax=Geobacillus thermodenitrificans TaxID=33940 RepID=A0ABY9QEX4_GEOTD|nr:MULTISPECIES: potassium channel family protein [Geobacillus]ARA97691.1 protein lctB [Geobacillus thermodenitrificans]ARP41595.1 Protein LctB [Geobacillus thermodenitrificans]ATO37019.1 protein lctB [Geobacillus thermodenitrificans]KQB94522.1 Protein LctB [Geobacillus sp. PA-3]MEC5189067.1 potassium channel LctB [Geobacillus thermodenitrificans]
MDYAFLGVVTAVLLGSITSIWTARVQATHRLSLDSLWVLVQWYVTMLLGFAMIYMILQVNGHAVFTPSSNSDVDNRLSLLGDSLYLSGITLLSVGYGDVTPIGIGRWIAITEALLGYIMPAVIVARTVFDWDRR